jgi:hypothetical protein
MSPASSAATAVALIRWFAIARADEAQLARASSGEGDGRRV